MSGIERIHGTRLRSAVQQIEMYRKRKRYHKCLIQELWEQHQYLIWRSTVTPLHFTCEPMSLDYCFQHV